MFYEVQIELKLGREEILFLLISKICRLTPRSTNHKRCDCKLNRQLNPSHFRV